MFPMPSGSQLIPNGGCWLRGEGAELLLSAGLSVLLPLRDRPALRVFLSGFGSSG